MPMAGVEGRPLPVWDHRSPEESPSLHPDDNLFGTSEKDAIIAASHLNHALRTWMLHRGAARALFTYRCTCWLMLVGDLDSGR